MFSKFRYSMELEIDMLEKAYEEITREAEKLENENEKLKREIESLKELLADRGNYMSATKRSGLL